MNLVVCRRQSMPLVSSSTTSNYLDEIQMAEATQTRNVINNTMYCVVRVSARRLFLFPLEKRFTMRVKVSKSGMPRRRKDNRNF